MSDIGSLSTFDEAQKEYFIRTRPEVTRESYCEVPILPIGTTEFLRRSAAPKTIDFMTIDIEGGELDALDTLDFDAYDIKIIVVETDRHQAAKDRLASQLLERRNYRPARMVGINQFWVKDMDLYKKVASIPFEGILDRRYARGARQQNVPIRYGAGENARERTVLDRVRNSLSKRWRKLTSFFL